MKHFAKLDTIHYNAMQMKLKGYQHKAIAKQLKKSVHTINAWFQDPLFKEEYNKLKEQMVEAGNARLHGLINKSINVLEETIDNNTKDHNQIKVAQDILDRVGLKAAAKQEIKMDGQITNTHELDTKLLEDEEAVEMLKKLFSKMSDMNE